jgi:hypothetical protein
MKNHFVHLLAVAGLVPLLAAAAWPQDEVEPAAHANIPFDFRAGSTSFSSGVYTFDVDPVTHAISVEQDSTGRVFYLAGVPANPAPGGRTSLTFEKLGDEYRLTELRAEVGGVELAPKNVTTLEVHGTH